MTNTSCLQFWKRAEGLKPTNLRDGGALSAGLPDPDSVWSLRTVKAEAEREAILAALEQTRWRRKDAAIMLRISLKALYNKLRLYGIDTQDHSAVVHYPVDTTVCTPRMIGFLGTANSASAEGRQDSSPALSNLSQPPPSPEGVHAKNSYS